MHGFFNSNTKAPFFIREGSKENCYSKVLFLSHYAGIARGTLESYKDRIVYVSGDYEIYENVYLIPHKTANLNIVGKSARMYVKVNGKLIPDDLSHEQSLVFDTEKGLVIFNSCSHAGADVIIKEVAETFKSKEVFAMVGGFHLYNTSSAKVKEFAKRIRSTGVKKIYTGHCTGAKSYRIIKEELGDIVSYLGTGMIFDI